mmetsp:Transcript_9114/g.41369  ORF Transcript_9114/g.41369 Transcript_9114/m.41369 type:complete len:308 (+) Transcript_9114:172-1095(+)
MLPQPRLLQRQINRARAPSKRIERLREWLRGVRPHAERRGRREQRQELRERAARVQRGGRDDEGRESLGRGRKFRDSIERSCFDALGPPTLGSLSGCPSLAVFILIAVGAHSCVRLGTQLGTQLGTHFGTPIGNPFWNFFREGSGSTRVGGISSLHFSGTPVLRPRLEHREPPSPPVHLPPPHEIVRIPTSAGGILAVALGVHYVVFDFMCVHKLFIVFIIDGRAASDGCQFGRHHGAREAQLPLPRLREHPEQLLDVRLLHDHLVRHVAATVGGVLYPFVRQSLVRFLWETKHETSFTLPIPIREK